MTVHYLTSTDLAARIGVQRGTLSRYKLPEPDVMIGNVRGWTAETIDAWNAARPGSGGWHASRRAAAEAAAAAEQGQA